MSVVDTYRAWLLDHPGDRFALYSLALALGKEGDDEGAVATFAELLTAHPSSGAGHYQLGLHHQQRGRLEAAQQAWDAGLEALRGEAGADARRSRAEIQAALDDLELLLD